MERNCDIVQLVWGVLFVIAYDEHTEFQSGPGRPWKRKEKIQVKETHQSQPPKCG